MKSTPLQLSQSDSESDIIRGPGNSAQVDSRIDFKHDLHQEVQTKAFEIDS